MLKHDEDLDRLEAAMGSCMRTIKKPGYWEELSRRARVNVDRPAAAILQVLDSGPCQFQSLVTRLGIEAPPVSRKVHLLEDLGLISRKQTNDKRVHELYLSNDGKKIANKIKAAKRQILSEVVSEWSNDDKSKLSYLLDRFATDMSNKLQDKTNKTEHQ